MQELVSCERCGLATDVLVDDYRPKVEALQRGIEFTYKTPLINYRKWVVCDRCFKIEPDSSFFKNNKSITKGETK